MAKSTIKLQIERNTIELANAFDVYVQRIICNHNFPVSLWQREMEHCCILIYCKVSFKSDLIAIFAIIFLLCENAVPDSGRDIICKAMSFFIILIMG